MRAHLLLLGLAAAPSFGCGDPAAPRPYNLLVAVSTSGVDGDTAYIIQAGQEPSRTVRISMVMLLPPGDHDVRLGGVAANCVVQGPDSVRVTVVPHELTSVTFPVECRSVTGAIEVAAPTSGRDLDPDGYAIRVDDVVRARVFSGSPTVIERVSPGSHVVTLSDFSANCSLSGPPAQTVVVTAGGLSRDTARTTFESSCRPITGDVRLITTTEGAVRDPNGYTITVDDEPLTQPCGFYDYGCEPGQPLLLLPNGVHYFYRVSPGDHTYLLGDVASNCTVAGGSFRTVAVVVGVTTVVEFDVRCEG